jgi:predicted nucleotidyltransferase
MYTNRTAKALVREFIEYLHSQNFFPERVVMFGSYAKGNYHQYSDIDVAIWHHSFEGSYVVDWEKVPDYHKEKKFIPIEIHFIPTVHEVGLYQGFIDEQILRYGQDIEIPSNLVI